MNFHEIKATALANSEALKVRYPALEALALEQGSTMREQILRSIPHDNPIRFSDCCLMDAAGFPRWGNCDHKSYLATFERMVKVLLPMGSDRKKLWGKIRNPNHSIFLDTLAEAVWAVRFSDMGLKFTYEAPLVPGNPSSGTPKDADFLIHAEDGPLWLDSVAIDTSSQKADAFPCLLGRSAEASMNIFVKRARGKYSKKFKQAVDQGVLRGQHTGVLINLFKSEKELLVPFLINGFQEPLSPVPMGLFTEDNIGLRSVTIANFVRPDGEEYLIPNLVAQWLRPSNHA